MKMPTPQISHNHCTTCGQLIGSKWCTCNVFSLDPMTLKKAIAYLQRTLNVNEEKAGKIAENLFISEIQWLAKQ